MFKDNTTIICDKQQNNLSTSKQLLLDSNINANGNLNSSTLK